MSLTLAIAATLAAGQPADVEAQVNGVLNLFDADGDRALDESELVALMRFTAEQNNKNPDNRQMDEDAILASARTALGVLDKDGDEKLSRSELEAMRRQ